MTGPYEDLSMLCTFETPVMLQTHIYDSMAATDLSPASTHRSLETKSLIRPWGQAQNNPSFTEYLHYLAISNEYFWDIIKTHFQTC